jgi:hypothetical protein
MSKKRDRRTWALDTETKGTGAEMVPLERLQERKRLRRGREPIRVIASEREGRADDPSAEALEQPAPRRFKVVDVLSREVLADVASAAETERAASSTCSSTCGSPWTPTGDR